MKSYLILLLCFLLGGYASGQGQTARADSSTATPAIRYRAYPLALFLGRLGLGIEFRKSPNRSFVLDGFFIGRYDAMDDVLDFQPGGEIRADYRIYRQAENERKRFFIGPGMSFRIQRYDVYDVRELNDNGNVSYYIPDIQKWRQRVSVHAKAGYEYRFHRDSRLLLEGYATGGPMYESVAENLSITESGRYSYHTVRPHLSLGLALKF